jgi:hypothetical protein
MDGIIIMVRDNFLIFLILFLLAQLAACGSESLPTDADIEDLYFNNKSAVEGLVDFCISNPGVKWLGVKPEAIDLSTAYNSKLDNVAVLKAQKKLADIGAVSLFCTRNWGELDYPLVSVTVPLYGAGISVSGVSKGIKFIFKNSGHVQAKVKSGKLKSLGDDGWYIFLYQ